MRLERRRGDGRCTEADENKDGEKKDGEDREEEGEEIGKEKQIKMLMNTKLKKVLTSFWKGFSTSIFRLSTTISPLCFMQ